MNDEFFPLGEDAARIFSLHEELDDPIVGRRQTRTLHARRGGDRDRHLGVEPRRR